MQHVLEQLFSQHRVVFLGLYRLRLLDILFCRVMEVFLARFVDEHLVGGLPQETLVESTNAIFSVSFIHNLDKIALLKHPNRVFDTLGCVARLWKG